MPALEPKPLSRGTSLTSLKRFYDNLPANKDVLKLGKSAGKLYKEAKSSFKNCDEESAYIYFMRYLNIVSFVTKSPDYKNKKAQLECLISNTETTDALNHAEKLSKSLEKRYAQKMSEDEKKVRLKDTISRSVKVDSKEILDSGTPHQNKENQDNPQINGLKESSSISSKELLQHLETDSSKVLIMDVRSHGDFSESHIDFEECMNIPEEIVVQGISAAKLAEKLSPSSKLKWGKRLNVNFLVLLDWFSSAHNLNPDSKVDCLKKILTEWDPNVTYHSKPLVLNGGYDDFLSQYPMKCTNAKPQIPREHLDEPLCLDDLKYPVLHDEPSPCEDLSNPREHNIFPPSDISSGMMSTLSSLSLGSHKSVPNIDRSSKAAALGKFREMDKKQINISEIPEKNTKLAESGLSDLKNPGNVPLSEDSNQILHSQVNCLQDHISTLEKEQREKDAVNNNLRLELEDFKRREREEAARKIPKPYAGRGTIRKEVEDISLAKEKQCSNEEKEDKGVGHSGESSRDFPHRNENYVPYDSSSNGSDVPLTPSASSGLKRSRSSPNIAQLGHELDSETKSTPHFDRSTKPSIKSVESNRHRNFQGVYGSTVKGGLTGLKNLGNSCYMNSILQCISNTSCLNKYFCTGEYQENLNKSANNPTRGEVAEEVAQVVRNLWMARYRFIGCRDLKNVVGRHMSRFHGSKQQDSHEFLTFLLDWLHNDLKKASSKIANQVSANTENDKDALAGATKAWENFRKYNDSIILQSFFVQQVSTVSCATCSVKSYTFEEPTSNLTLLLPNAPRCSLLDCFRLYTAQESISDYKCENCSEPREAEKKVDLCRLPPVLVIHLKRFYSDGFYQKRQTFVDFPLKNLNLQDFTLDKKQRYTSYNLYGVSNHYGTLEGGHYTAYCKNVDKWYKFDDQDVSEMSASDVRSSSAYILFYAAA